MVPTAIDYQEMDLRIRQYGRITMDLRDLENDVQRRVGYSYFVTGGVDQKGPYLDFNGRQRMLRVWIPREGAEADKIAEAVTEYMADDSEPSYKQIDMTA